MKGKTYDIVYPNPTPEGVVLEKNVYATMRDGIKIALDVYKPIDDKGPLPVILAYSSFAKERIFESAKPAFYCRNGYICVQAAERGIGLNEGQFTFQGPKAAEDGYDIIEWIAAQPWCDGNVAMMGASGYGVMQWITAPLNPPHLKALVLAATTDNYRGLCYPGGVLRKPFVQYLVTGFAIGAYWPGPVPNKEGPMNVMGAILENCEDGQFWWEHGSAWQRVGEIKAPILNLIHTPNRLHAMYHLRSYKDIKSPKKLMVVPWTGEYYQPFIFETISYNLQIKKWLDYWLKGIDTGIMAEPEVAIYDNGTAKWRYENEFPLKRTLWEKFYLRGNFEGEKTGLISNEGSSANEKPDIFHNISLNADMATSYGANNEFGGKDYKEPRQLIYLSEPLKEDLTLYGPISATLYAATAEEVTSDWSFFVKLGELVAEGVPINPATGLPEGKPEATDRFTPPEVQLWSWGSLKCKYREVDKEMSLPGMPWHPFNKAEELKPDTVYEFEIEMQPVFKTFKKGNRLWLKIACDDITYSTRDISSRFIETPFAQEKSEISIFRSAEYPSHLLLPVIPSAPETIQVTKPLSEAVPGAPRVF